MKRLHLLATMLLLCLAALAEASESFADAEKAWPELQTVASAKLPTNVTMIEFTKIRESQALRYRDLGLRFYQQFPGDSRRWEWLLRTVEHAPRYLVDVHQAGRAIRDRRPAWIEIDRVTKQAWDERYWNELRPAFLVSPAVSEKMRARLLQREVWALIREGSYRAQRGELVDFDVIQRSLLDFAAEPAAADVDFNRYLNHFFGEPDLWLMDKATQHAILEELMNSPNIGLRLAAESREQMMRLHDVPFDLKMKTMTGETLDITHWRGKVVLVDFWATTCSSCIAAMPRIKAVYDKYHTQGFEVLGIAFDDESRRPKVEAVLRQLGITWPTAMQAWKESPHPKRFGFTGVPVTFLLDQNGRLVTNDIDHGKGSKLEDEVRKLLGLPPFLIKGRSTGSETQKTSGRGY